MAVSKDEKIKLISQTVTQDADGFETVTETETAVFAKIDSITGQEFTNAGQLNIQPAFRAVVWSAEYGGQKIIKRGGERFGIYRTFVRNKDEIELYAERKAGA